MQQMYWLLVSEESFIIIIIESEISELCPVVCNHFRKVSRLSAKTLALDFPSEAVKY